MSVFTEIIAGTIPGRFAYADEHCVAFATIEPLTHGHLLVVPRMEVDRLTDLDEYLVAHLFTVAQRIGRAQEKAFASTRAMMIVAGLEVPHAHIHVFPATSEANLNFRAAMRDVPGDVLDEDVSAIREALIELGFAEYVPADLHAL